MDSEAVKKRWPSDAVMIVCPWPAQARRSAMNSVNPGNCRDCGRNIVYDGFSMRRALAMPGRRGRPVKFFCIPCSVHYDFRTITCFEDHRGHKESIRSIAEHLANIVVNAAFGFRSRPPDFHSG